MTSLIKKLSIALTTGLVIAVGFVAPAQAAPGVTIDSPVPTFYENSPAGVFSVTVEHSGNIPTGFGPLEIGVSSWQPLAGCPTVSTVSVPSAACGITSVVAVGGGTVTSPTVTKIAGVYKFDWSGTTSAVKVTFASTAFTTSTTGSKTLTARIQGTPYTTSVTVTAGSPPPSSSTVTFNANGGSGAMADQSGSSATALSSNVFTRSGYTFAGWNTAADGSGTAYADGASYAFSSSTTLYAQWTPTLATTGFDSKPYLYTAFALAIAGAALMLLSSRRKQDI
jgi:uncharacterized repeat protein (TIGR02543 family)/LPXTG-motif cell wall-anchored protein